MYIFYKINYYLCNSSIYIYVYILVVVTILMFSSLVYFAEKTVHEVYNNNYSSVTNVSFTLTKFSFIIHTHYTTTMVC